MANAELPVELADEIRRRVFDEPGLIKVTQVLRRGGNTFRVSLRPVEIRGERKFQGEMTDEGRTKVKNFDMDQARAGLEEMIAQYGTRELHLVTASGDLHIRVTKKGKILQSRSGKLAREVDDAPAHDRVKRLPLNAFHAQPLLQAIGIADADGRIKVSMRGKYDQVNAFLRVIDEVLPAAEDAEELTIVDCGCGRAYLTLAVYVYLTTVKGRSVRVCGIDRRHDVITTARQLAEDLDCADRVTFIEGDIDTVTLPFEKVGVVLSLHACDTATDAALARGIEWGAAHLLCVPCCQHELHKTLKTSGPMAGVLRHGILRERLADLLTDTFRAQILRIMGYRVQVVEFVSSDATARNILLRAESALKRGMWAAVSEYLELRDFWRVTPWLESRLGPSFAKLLTVCEEKRD
ncbi:MAG: SAM-dependent methyltransferase [Kiritimatiellae bacterium]|nr:SAM-dependent methyltransferase [Kiritimatiellia bacterium]